MNPCARSAWIAADGSKRSEAVAVCFAVAACLVHFMWNGRYGYFRDELYYAACGQHLAWGYVDHAPLIAVVARLSRCCLGTPCTRCDFSPRCPPAQKYSLPGGSCANSAGAVTRRFLPATAMLLCPIYLTMDNFLSMNAFEPVFWMLCVAISLRIIRTGNDRLWLLFGLVAGIGILNKHSMLIFRAGIFPGVGRDPPARDCCARRGSGSAHSSHS